MRQWAKVCAGVAVGGLLACAAPRLDAPFDEADTGSTCAVGAEACPCTDGGACDAGLECRSGVCVAADAPTTGATMAEADATTASSAPGSSGEEDDGPRLDVYADGDLPADDCDQDVDVVFTMDVSTTMTFFFDALLADMADVDSALADVNANPHYGLIVFVDDYAVVMGGAPFDNVGDLQTEFMTWKMFTTNIFDPQLGGGTNTTYPENSLDALWHAAESFQWRDAESTLRLVIHATDDTFSEAPAVLDGIAVEHTYDETVAALQDNQIRVAAFAATVGGPLFDPQPVGAGWFDPWNDAESIPDATGGVVFHIDGILNGTQSLGDAIVETVEEVECTPYPEG